MSRNGGAKIKASRKTAHNKVFFWRGGGKKWWDHEKCYSPKSVYWY